MNIKCYSCESGGRNTLLVYVRPSCQKKLYNWLGILDTRCDHERGPAAVVLDVWIEGLLLREELDDLEGVGGAGPVNWIAAVIVFAGGEFRVRLG